METDPAGSAKAADPDQESIEESRMTLSEHLAELRIRLIRGTAAFLIAFMVLYVYRAPVEQFIQRPQKQAWGMLHEKLFESRLELVKSDPDVALVDYFYDEYGADLPPETVLELDANEMPTRALVLKEANTTLTPMTSLSAGGPFFLSIKVCFYLSMFIAGPVFLWELWMFIAAGLYKKERRAVYGSLPPSILLFFAGNAFGYMFMVPYAIYFTQSDGIDALEVTPRMMDYDLYFQWLRTLTLALGVVFQLPIFQVMLSRAGIVNPKVYAKYRGHCAIGALAFAAIITPPDPFTQVLLAGPTIILWEVGYWCSRVVWREPLVDPVSDELEVAGV